MLDCEKDDFDMPKSVLEATHRLSKGEILLSTWIDLTILHMAYYQFSSIGLDSIVRHTPIGYRPLSSIDFHGLMSAWGECALLLCTSKKLFDIFGPRRIATSYSDQHYRWLFVHQKGALVVYRADVVKQPGVEIDGEIGEVSRKVRDLRQRLYSLRRLYRYPFQRDFASNSLASGVHRKRKLSPICPDEVAWVVENTPDLHFTSAECSWVRIYVPSPIMICIIEQQVEERLTQALCKRYADTVRHRELILVALEKVKDTFPGCLDACLGDKGIGSRIREYIKSIPELHILFGIVGATDIETIREWVCAIRSESIDIEDELSQLMD
jgi:hypothetical protein